MRLDLNSFLNAKNTKLDDMRRKCCEIHEWSIVTMLFRLVQWRTLLTVPWRIEWPSVYLENLVPAIDLESRDFHYFIIWKRQAQRTCSNVIGNVLWKGIDMLVPCYDNFKIFIRLQKIVFSEFIFVLFLLSNLFSVGILNYLSTGLHFPVS